MSAGTRLKRRTTFSSQSKRNALPCAVPADARSVKAPQLPLRRSTPLHVITVMKLFSRTTSPVSLSPPPTPPLSPRLHHGPPPFHEGWANVRLNNAPSKLRFCTLAGPSLRYSASPGHDILAGSFLVYGATVTAEEFPILKVIVRGEGGKLCLYAENRQEHSEWHRQLVRASTRCVTEHYRFLHDLRPTPFGRASVAEGDAGVAMVKVTGKAGLKRMHVGLARLEAAVLLGLPEHECVLNVVDVYESARTVYIVCEHVKALTVAEVVQSRGGVCEAEVATIIRDVLRGLVHVHRHGVAHRMVCAENVLVTLDGDKISGAKLWNFELAVSALDAHPPLSVLQCFKEGPLELRHASYVAPEVARGERGDYKQDVWATGVLMHFLLVGCTPFEGGSGVPAVLGNVASARGGPSFGGPLWRGVTMGAKHLCASLLNAEGGRVSALAALRHPWLEG